MATLDWLGYRGAASAKNGGEQPHDLMVQVYCHSYPHAVSRADVLDSETMLLHCDMSRIPAHAFLEVEFELFLDNEIKSYRVPVYQLNGQEGSMIRFSFEPDGAVIESFEKLGRKRLQSETA